MELMRRARILFGMLRTTLPEALALPLIVPLVLAVAACAAPPREYEGLGPVGGGILGEGAPFLNPFKRTLPGDSAASSRAGRGPITGYSDPGADGAPRPATSGTRAPGGDGETVTLNFVNAEVQDFVRVTFDEILKEPVVIDPQIQGRITVRSGEPITRAQAIDMVRAALDTYGIRLAKQGNVYHVSARGGQPGRPRNDGNIRIVRLQSITPEQARSAIQPMTQGQVEISANNEGRYLLLSGPPNDVDGLAQVIGALDVDQMRSVSFALVPLKEASAVSVSQELTQMFGGRDNQNFQAIAIQRVNGVLITARSRETLNRAQN